MTQSLGMRATSFGASAALLGLAIFAALSATISMQLPTFNGPGPISVETLPPPEPPKPIVQRQDPPVRQLPDEAIVIDTLPPTPVSDAPQTVTYIPRVETGPAQITNPRWLRQPRDLGIYYPARALARELPGEAVLDCLVTVSGALNCSVVSETPANWGFGQAALRISRDYRMVPATRDGQAVEGRYRMRVPFEVR